MPDKPKTSPDKVSATINPEHAQRTNEQRGKSSREFKRGALVVANDVYLGQVQGVVTNSVWNSCFGFTVVAVQFPDGLTRKYEAGRIELLEVQEKRAKRKGRAA